MSFLFLSFFLSTNVWLGQWVRCLRCHYGPYFDRRGSLDEANGTQPRILGFSDHYVMGKLSLAVSESDQLNSALQGIGKIGRTLAGTRTHHDFSQHIH